MKKTLLIFVSVILFSLMGCSKADDVKQNWIFTVTTTISSSPAQDGYPMSASITVERDNLTSDEADIELKTLETPTQSMTQDKYTITTAITATKAVKK